MYKAYLIQCIGSNTYNVAVIPTNDRDRVLTIARRYIDTNWCVDVDTVELFLSDLGEVINVEVEGHSDEDYFVISEVEMIGFNETI